MNKTGTARSAKKHSGGAGNCRSLGISERVSSTGTSRCVELLDTLRVRIVRIVSLIHPLSMQHEPKDPLADGHRSNIPERATGHSTSPSVHACPTPHRRAAGRHRVDHPPLARAHALAPRAPGPGPYLLRLCDCKTLQNSVTPGCIQYSVFSIQ